MENQTESAEIRALLKKYWEYAQDATIVITDEDRAEVILRAAKVADSIVAEFEKNAEDAWKYRDLSS